MFHSEKGMQTRVKQWETVDFSFNRLWIKKLSACLSVECRTGSAFLLPPPAFFFLTFIQKKCSSHHCYSFFASSSKWTGLLEVSTNAMSSANFTAMLTRSKPFRLLVHSKNRTGEITVPWGEPVDVSMTGEVQLLTLTNWSLLRRKSSIQRIMWGSTWSSCSLAQRMWGCMPLKAEEKSTNRVLAYAHGFSKWLWYVIQSSPHPPLSGFACRQTAADRGWGFYFERRQGCTHLSRHFTKTDVRAAGR